MHYRMGIDIGSKTAKLVVLDDKNSIVHSQYSLHRSNARKTISELLANTIWRFGDHEVEVCITGSAGMRFAQDLDLPYVQEVIATRRALQTFLPQADVAIELGGEDAKILFMRDSVEERMNGSCAGGTGGFIDVMGSMLGVNARQFNALALGYKHIYPIASRCAVFAQNDVRPLLNAGARKSDIAASVLQAVVTQTISGLACGRPIEGKVAFLGGPIEVYSELVQCFRKTLSLSHAQTLKPKDAHLFVASGAALMPGSKLFLQDIKNCIDKLSIEQEGSANRLSPLFNDNDDYQTFKKRHAKSKVSRLPLMGYEGDVFIGIDAGSTTFKLAVINTQGDLVYSTYENNKGDVVETTRLALQEFYRSCPHEYDGTQLIGVKRSKVCGYGEDLLKEAFCLDSGEVETVAHLRAAKEFCPDVSFVLDIGGQDIKCLGLSDGQIDTIMLNEACSSGCGALLQGFARSFGMTKWTFAAEAISADNPVDLGTRCTVFMTSRVRHAQKEGVSTANISAGLAYSVVRNALYKVMGLNSLSQLGKKVVAQGGAFMNDAVLRAFELESDLEVTRPDIANLMGAYGAALLARDEYLEKHRFNNDHLNSSILDAYEVAALKQHQQSIKCEACANGCSLSLVRFELDCETESKQPYTAARKRAVQEAGQHEARKALFVSGNRCERGNLWAKGVLKRRELPKQAILTHSTDSIHLTRKQSASASLGIVPVLNLYEYYPFWQTLFLELGFDVLPKNRSTADIYRLGAKHVLSESVCYPAKLMHGHISQLCIDGAEFIFMPTFVRDVNQACPVALRYGQIAKHDMRLLSKDRTLMRLTSNGIRASSKENATLLSIELKDNLPTVDEVCDLIKQTTKVPDIQLIEKALAAATKAQKRNNTLAADRAAKALKKIETDGCLGIVLLGHPYHSDPGINHGIDGMFIKLGYTVISAFDVEQAIELHFKLKDVVADNLPGAMWPQVKRLYKVAHFVAKHPRLHLVHLHSFGCGIDATIAPAIKAIIRNANKPYTAIKLDEMVDPASLRIRIRSLDYALKAGNNSTNVQANKSCESNKLSSLSNNCKTNSYQTLVLTEVTQKDIEYGLATLNNDLCYPMLAWGGQILRHVNMNPGKYSVELPRLCKNCRGELLEKVLNLHMQNDSAVVISTVNSICRITCENADVVNMGKRKAQLDRDNTAIMTAGGKLKIGVIGNSAMLFTSAFNDGLLSRIIKEGACPILPDERLVSEADNPLADLLPYLYKQGIRDFIYVQSFSCLRSHVDARGLMPSIKETFKDINITFLEYDPGASQINQLSRLKLAIAIAAERH